MLDPIDEFNNWMLGIQKYEQLTLAGQAYVDEYLEEYSE